MKKISQQKSTLTIQSAPTNFTEEEERKMRIKIEHLEKELAAEGNKESAKAKKLKQDLAAQKQEMQKMKSAVKEVAKDVSN